MSRVTNEDGRVTEVTEPRVRFCPLFAKLRGIEELDEGTIRVDVDGEAFVINTGLYGNPTLYEYRSTVIPTADEARQLASDNIPQ